MRILLDIDVSDTSLHGYTQEEFVTITTDLIKKYWYDEGLIFDDRQNKLTIYKND